MGAIITKKVQLTREFDVSSTAVEKWTNRTDFPGGKDGPWDVDQVREFLVSINSPAAGRAGSSCDADTNGEYAHLVAKQRARKLEEEVRKLSLANDYKAGLLVPREEVEVAANELIHWIADQLQQIPEQLAPSFPANQRAELAADVANQIRMILRRMADWGLGPGATAA